MIRHALTMIPLALAVTAAGPLSTLTLGRYVCERPAVPGSQAAVIDPRISFAVTTASRYIAADGTRGTYLLTGNTLEMTSGPLAGTRLVRLRTGFLRLIEANGVPGQTRCVLSRSSDKH